MTNAPNWWWDKRTQMTGKTLENSSIKELVESEREWRSLAFGKRKRKQQRKKRRNCPSCNGRGDVGRLSCLRCNGTGKVTI